MERFLWPSPEVPATSPYTLLVPRRLPLAEPVNLNYCMWSVATILDTTEPSKFLEFNGILLGNNFLFLEIFNYPNLITQKLIKETHKNK